MKQYTWRRTHGIEKSRIGLFVVHDTIVTLIHSCDIRPAQIKHTDHLAVSIKNKLVNERGPGYWKFNQSLLHDIDYVNMKNLIIDEMYIKYPAEYPTYQITGNVQNGNKTKNNSLFKAKT